MTLKFGERIREVRKNSGPGSEKAPQGSFGGKNCVKAEGA